ncbi:MAG: hypothetical protein HYY29_01280 [Chloroflexi bacterium]|nr:hypothetical protein [Chloroflexota bacterium]
MKIRIASRRCLRLLPLVIILSLSGGIAYGATSVNKTLPAGVSVNLQASPEGALGFYFDSAGASPINSLNFGEVKPGNSGMTRIYIKNLTTTTSFRYFTAADDLPKGTAAVFPYDVNPTGSASNLIPGQSRSFDVFLNLDPDIPVGAHQFTVTLTATTP